MKKSKTLAIVLVALSLFAVGCVSDGMKKPPVFVAQYNNIPADIPSQFVSRYERIITGKEQKEFNNLLTDEERQAFIDKFWLERDIDSATPENEEKERIDQLIDNIADEPFISTPGVFGLSFRMNGGFRGDMAHVYLLHGEPDAMDTLESTSQSFVDLMLWIYVDEYSGNIRYAFLFYQRGGSGAYYLFLQDAYKLDFCGAINEIKTFKEFYIGSGNRACPPDVEDVFRELQSTSSKGGVVEGYIFAWSLFNFSQDSSISQGAALQPPKSASEIAKQSTARVTGEAPEIAGIAGTDYILASCEKCNSLIPAELQLGKEFTLSVRRSDIDWRVVGNQTEVELKVRIILENTMSQAPLVFEKKAPFTDRKDLIISDPVSRIVVTLLTSDEVAQIPAGTYQVSVYVKNVTPGLITKKYNAWSKEITK